MEMVKFRIPYRRIPGKSSLFGFDVCYLTGIPVAVSSLFLGYPKMSTHRGLRISSSSKESQTTPFPDDGFDRIGLDISYMRFEKYFDKIN